MGVFRKLGLPEDAEKYEVKFKEGASVDDDFAKDFRVQAHKLGVLPKQAQALADWFSDLNKSAVEQSQAAAQAAVQEGLANLKKEWGEGYGKKLGAAQKLVREFKEDFPGLGEALDATGAGNNPVFIKFFSKVAETLWKEDSFVDHGDAGGGTGMTPSEAKAAVNKIMGDQTHPYWIKDHPGHKAAVAEVQNLIKAQQG